MNPALRLQLRHLDQALLSLVDERVRATSELDERSRAVALEDLLRRYGGPLTRSELEDLFASIERAGGAWRKERGSP
jgi:hypothetical protein